MDQLWDKAVSRTLRVSKAHNKMALTNMMQYATTMQLPGRIAGTQIAGTTINQIGSAYWQYQLRIAQMGLDVEPGSDIQRVDALRAYHSTCSLKASERVA